MSIGTLLGQAALEIASAYAERIKILAKAEAQRQRAVIEWKHRTCTDAIRTTRNLLLSLTHKEESPAAADSAQLTLLDLAREFDGLPADFIESRVAISVQMDALLGVRKEEFDDRFTALVTAEPDHPAPAIMTLYAMQLTA